MAETQKARTTPEQLTARGSQGSVKYRLMKNPLHDRIHSAQATTVALITAFALLIAPMCAPLCAARRCSSHAGNESCHETQTPAANGHQLLANGKSCTTPEFSAVLSKSAEQLLSLRENQSKFKSLLVLRPEIASAEYQQLLSVSTMRRISFTLPDPQSATTILRI